MTALLRVIYYAMLEARAAAALADGKGTEIQGEALKRIASLMDVAHNIPLGLIDYDKWDEARVKKDLRFYGERFPDGIKLLEIYENSLKNSDKSKPT